MLDRTEKKLRSYFDNEPMLGTDGQLHEMDGVTQIQRRQCDVLAQLHKSVKPDLSLETGLAYGFSSLPILDAMEEHGYGHHIAIDPGQLTFWHGVALKAIEDLGFSHRFTWINARSDKAMADMVDGKKKTQFAFFDGLHSFEGILTDAFMADQLLEVGGMLVFNQNWMPVGRAISSYISKNWENYKAVPVANEIMFAFRKERKDDRGWDHFAPFDGSGQVPTKATLLQKLLGGRR